ncbi:nitroreductase family protein [Mangrovibacterium diazotrophicum]|uniref:Nitroreductase n=1 Tax=Mangrovibacterium diazotrophicum TaxID=1261403 RepID=A0A419W983_9BACT|nr:nitroreductase family protein [Mangrovibacterium diazotrophicum]RKD91996.1 nitroreductase [Mangrovibacterium diazotrophicum]
MLKQTVKKIIPPELLDRYKKKKKVFSFKKGLKKSYEYDYTKYVLHSNSIGNGTADKLIGDIIKEYHVIEKGLTMPDTRLGFGQPKLINLINNCIKYINLYGNADEQVAHAIQVILEYEDFHRKENYILLAETIQALSKIKESAQGMNACSQREVSKAAYFSHIEDPFPEFSESRSSIRNYSQEEVPIKEIEDVLILAKNTPSACNRQTWRTYVYTNKNRINKILEVQGGNRGFGHLANKLIVITSELGVFSNTAERYQAYVDGGMYAMNLLYSLHSHKIAACILNCSNPRDKDIKMREVCNIKDSEVFIAMITCGYPPEEFKIAISKRYTIEKTHQTIND